MKMTAIRRKGTCCERAIPWEVFESLRAITPRCSRPALTPCGGSRTCPRGDSSTSASGDSQPLLNAQYDTRRGLGND